jgi:hypothetical protein
MVGAVLRPALDSALDPVLDPALDPVLVPVLGSTWSPLRGCALESCGEALDWLMVAAYPWSTAACEE